MTTREYVESILGDKTDQAIELANHLLELKLNLTPHEYLPNLFVDEYGRQVYMTKFGVKEVGTIPIKIDRKGGLRIVDRY